MKVVINTSSKLGKLNIAEYLFKGEKIKHRLKKFLKNNNIQVEEKKSAIGPNVIDLSYVYDARKLLKLIKKGKNVSKAIIIKNTKKCHLNYMGCLYERKEWNPLSKFYVEPWGEKIGFWLRNSKVTPNMTSFINITLSIIASALLFLGYPGLILFGIWVRFFHMFDIVDGQLARLKCQGSNFGRWVDGAGDRVVVSFWYIAISIFVYFQQQNILYLFAGLLLLYGSLVYNYLLYTSVAYFRQNKFNITSTSKIKQNPIVQFLLLFIAHDIQLHLLTFAALFNLLHLYLIFYAVYFNFIWFAYFLFYLTKYIRDGDIREA